jgi:hypothetical protein
MSAHGIEVAALSAVILALLFGVIAALRGLPKKWVEAAVDHRFKLKQDELNRAHQEKLAAQNHDNSKAFSRVSKVHEQEYKILPQAWLYLQIAYSSSSRALNGFTCGVKFDTMGPEEVEEFLSKHPAFSRTQKEAIKYAPTANERFKKYHEAVQITALDALEESQRKFRNYVIKNSLFMSTDVHKALDGISLKLIEVNSRFTSGDAEMKHEARVKVLDMQEDINALFVTLQERLYVSEA